jgi:hypothetical protein
MWLESHSLSYQIVSFCSNISIFQNIKHSLEMHDTNKGEVLFIFKGRKKDKSDEIALLI